MANLAFACEESKRSLNQLVHPFLLAELRRQIRVATKKYDLIVVDAALLLDWDMDREMDYVLVVHASQQVRLQRLAKRGISKDDALARQRAQLPYHEFRRRADRIILNNGSKDSLRKKLARLIKQIEKKNC